MSSINRFRHRKIRDKYLITTDHGTWKLVDKKDFISLLAGDIRKELEDELADAGIVLTKDNISSIKEKYWKRFGFMHEGPSLHIVVVTLRCDQKCIYCHASSRGKDQTSFDMTEDTAKNTVDTIFQTPSKNITIEFQGGEPLLNFSIIRYITTYSRILEKRFKKNLELTMVSNLQQMTEDILDYCLKNDIHLCTSLDGPEHLHDRNRPKESHRKTVYWIRRINEELEKRNIRNTRMNALVTITRTSLKYPVEIVDEYISLGLAGLHLRYMNKLGNAVKNSVLIDYEPEEFIAFWKTAMDHILSVNKKKRFVERGAVIILKKILTEKDPNFLDMRSPCGAVTGQLAYDYDGSVFCCDEARTLDDDLFKIGDVDKKNLKEMCSSEDARAVISESINDSTVCDLCAYKPFCGICPVCTYAEQGTTSGNIPITSRCRIFKAQFDYIFEKYLFDEKARKIFDSWMSGQ